MVLSYQRGREGGLRKQYNNNCIEDRYKTVVEVEESGITVNIKKTYHTTLVHQ